MTQIKSAVFFDSSKLKDIFDSTGFVPEGANIITSFIAFVHHFLPLRLKFMSESYVAYEGSKILGMLSLEKDEKSRKRLKITRMYLEENSLDAAKLLIQYVIMRFCAMGAVSYKVVVEDSRADLLSLFIDGCGFRKNSQEFLYKIEPSFFDYDESVSLDGFKFYNSVNSGDVCRLYNSNINSFQRHSFSRTREQFEPDFATGMKDKTSFSYVLEDEIKGKVYGYFNVSTYNNVDYLLDFVLDAAFEVYFRDALDFIAHCLNMRTKKWNLYVKIKTCFANYKIFKDFADTHSFSLVKSSVVLTKDYLKEIKESNIINSAKIVFNEITPAFKANN